MPFGSRTDSQNTAASTSSKVLATVYLSVFVGIGGLLFFFVLQGAWQSVSTRWWSRVECTIEKSTLAPSAAKYLLDIHYRYVLDGQPRTGTQITSKGNEFPDATSAQQAMRRYAPGTKVPGYARGGDAVLDHTSLWPLVLFAFFPLVFVIGGGALLINVWAGESPTADRVTGWMGCTAGVIMGGYFMAIGAVVVWDSLVAPFTKSSGARSWISVPCVMEIPALEQKSPSADAVEFRYRYEYQGVEHIGDRYRLTDIFSSLDREEQRAVLVQYPAGSQQVCYVNPADPDESSLQRDASPRWLGTLGLGFVLMGGVTVIGVFKQERKPPCSSAL